MNPVKAKDLISVTAERFNHHEKDVSQVVRLYWKMMRQALSSLPEPVITVANFGEFRIKPWLINDEISRIIKMEQHLQNRPVRNNTVLDSLASKRKMLNNINHLIGVENLRKISVKEKKDVYRKSDSDLEK